MSAGETKSNLFCNYCGEAVTLDGAYSHVSKYHEARIHPDPTTYKPGRTRRVRAVQIISAVMMLVILAAILLLLGEDMTGQIALIVIFTYAGGLMSIFGVGEYLVRKGEKPVWEIMMDLTIECDICSARVAWRDKEMHDELKHPEEKEIVRKVYTPAAVVMLALIGMGFGGLVVTIALGELDKLTLTTGVIGILLFTLCIVAGLVFGLVFEFRYHRPRVERLRNDWSEKHGRDYGTESRK